MAVDLANAYTLLTLGGIGESPYAMRGLDVKFDVIEQAKQIAYNINFGVIDFTDPASFLYRITIGCTDRRAPPFGGLKPGTMPVILSSPIEVGQVTLSSDRPAVSGSTNSEDGVTFFRPQLTTFVVDFNWGGNEYSGWYTWSLVLQEYVPT